MLARLAECCQNDGVDDNDVGANYDSDDATDHHLVIVAALLFEEQKNC